MRLSIFRQILAANLASLTVFLAGCWISWASIALKKLGDTEPDLEHIGFRLSKYQISWMTCLLDLGNVMSPILACQLMNFIGRKKTILLSYSIFCVPLFFLFYENIEILYLARFSVGFAKGMSFATITLYISEVSETSVRGSLVSISSSLMYVGLTAVLVVGPFISLRSLNISLCALPLIFIVLFFFIPESPYYLVSSKNHAQAKESLKWFRNSENVDEEYEDIVKKTNAIEDGGFQELFGNRSNRRALVIVLVTGALQRLGGITSLIVFGPKTFPDTSISFLGPSQSSFILMLTLVAGSISQIRLSDTLGRKRLLQLSSFLDSLFLFLTGVYFIFPSLEYSYAIYLLLMGYGFCYNGIGCVPYILVGELFPMNTRCQASSLAGMALALGSFLTNKFHFLLVSYTNTAVVFWIYAAFNFTNLVFATKFVFETKCKTFEEIQDILRGYAEKSKTSIATVDQVHSKTEKKGLEKENINIKP